MKTIADSLNELKTRQALRAKRLEKGGEIIQNFRASFARAAKVVHEEGWRGIANSGFNPGLVIEQAGTAVTSVWITVDKDGWVHALRHGEVEIERIDPSNLNDASHFDEVVSRWVVAAIDVAFA